MKTSELKKIVESYEGYYCEVGEKQCLEIKHLRFQFGKVYKNHNEIWFNFCSTQSVAAKKIMMAMIEYSETPVAEREDKTYTFTEFEKQLLQEGFKDYPYIARDSNNELWLFRIKPFQNIDGIWGTNRYTNVSLNISKFSHLFKSISPKDEEPCEWGKWV